MRLPLARRTRLAVVSTAPDTAAMLSAIPIACALVDGENRFRYANPAAEQFFALIQTRLYMKRQLRLTGVPSAAQIDHVVESAVRLFLRGYAV